MSDPIHAVEPIKRDLLYLKTSDAICAYIKANDLKPGDKLPTERQLAEMYQIGRNAVREALRFLADRGVIEIRPSRGAYVRDQSTSQYLLQLDLSGYEYADIQNFRSAIEIQAICNVIRRASQEEKKEIHSIARELQEMAAVGVYSDTVDYKFHSKIMEYNRNPLISEFVLLARDSSFVHQMHQQPDNSIWLPTVVMHVKLAEAILNNDAAGAIRAQIEADEYVASIDLQSRFPIRTCAESVP